MSFTPFDNNNANSSKRSVGLPLSFPSHSMISLISNANPNTMSLNIVPGCMVPIRSMASTNTVESSRVEELTQEALRLTREAFHGVSKGQHQAEQIANDEGKRDGVFSSFVCGHSRLFINTAQKRDWIESGIQLSNHCTAVFNCRFLCTVSTRYSQLTFFLYLNSCFC